MSVTTNWIEKLINKHQLLASFICGIVMILFLGFVFAGAIIQKKIEILEEFPLISVENKRTIIKELALSQSDEKKCNCICK
jgi:hypothetical protein